VRWPRSAQRALQLLVVLLLAATAWTLTHPPRPALRPVADDATLALTVDPNRAGRPALEAVPGIGPALAARILAYRAERGPFASVEQLAAVPGIGPKTLAAVRPYLEIGGPGPERVRP